MNCCEAGAEQSLVGREGLVDESIFSAENSVRRVHWIISYVRSD